MANLKRDKLSAVIAVYRDAQAVPIMHKRLCETFQKIGCDGEIIFVNDCSPDDSEEVIRTISRDDRRVIGISHSRNFGSQAAFVSVVSPAASTAAMIVFSVPITDASSRKMRVPLSRSARSS